MSRGRHLLSYLERKIPDQPLKAADAGGAQVSTALPEREKPKKKSTFMRENLFVSTYSSRRLTGAITLKNYI
jgi:hypothetical protein